MSVRLSRQVPERADYPKLGETTTIAWGQWDALSTDSLEEDQLLSRRSFT
jgi:hypothetical protein